MKQPRTFKNPVAHAFLSLAIGIIAVIGMALPARAGLTGPYTNDFYTLHLWHMQDTSGTIPGVATNGVFEFDYATNPLVVPLLLSNTPGPDLIGGAPTAYSLAGQAGPGVGSLFTSIGTNFGYAMSIQTTQTTAFYAPWSNIGNNDFPDLSYAETNDSCSFVNTNTGAFTWEALIQPGFNPLTDTADKNPEILCSDGPNSTTPGTVPYTVRAVQFRFDNATPSSGQAELEFNGNITALAGESHDFLGMLPTAGPDALAQGTWYHIAAAFTGTAPTNGDPPNVFTLYWTKFDPTRSYADVLTNIPNAFTFTNTSTHTVFSLPYPSNSIIGTGPFVIGQSARLSAGAMSSGGGWKGNIAEVRISDYYRHSNEFMFNNSIVPSKPLVTGPATNNFVGYGQTLNLSVQVSGSQPYAYQWYQSGASLAGETNSTLIVSNITYAANAETFFAIVTNGYGSATSAVATVTVGATLDGLFNTGCGSSYNPLDQTAPGSVDLHWMFTPNGNPDNNSPNAIVWNDGSPLASGGGVAPDNGAAVWIWAHENSGKVSGTYSLQTSFQVDETVATNTVVSGTVGALGATGGAMQMVLNGVETDVILSGNPAENVYAFSITNGVQPGSNTLVCTSAQSGSGTAGNNGFDLAILSDTGVALTNAPDIINEPANTTNILGSTVSFQAVAVGAPPLTYYWLSNGVAITSPVWVYTAVPYLSFVATNFNPSELVGTNFYANYQIVFSNFVGSVTSQVATLDVQIPPLTVVSAGVPIWDLSNDETNIVVYFSGAVDPTTATIAGNYMVNGNTVTSVVMGSAPGEVVLTLSSPLSSGPGYTLTVQNVNSAFGVAMNPLSASISVGTYPTTVDLWVKAGVGVVADGNGNVSQWNDMSGNANNLQTGGNDPQLLQNAIDGQPMVEFTGTNGTYLFAGDEPSLEITSNMSVFAVINFATLAGGTNGDIVSKVNNNNEPAPYDYYVQPGNTHFLRGNGTTSAQVLSTNSPSTGVPHILDVVMQGTQVTHRLDANPDGSGTLSTQIADQGQALSVGAREDFHNFLTGGMAELILVGQALSSSDVASIENYLATEYHMPTGTNSYPVITQEPIANTNINQGAVVIVPAAASGTPAVAYQWFDVSNLAQAGQTNATLVISNDAANDTYYLVATNVYGSVTSSVVAVTVNAGLNVSLGPPAITLYLEQSVTLTAQASGTLPFYYQWYQNNSPIANATNASYAAIAASSPVNYTCTVSNDYNGYSSTNAGPVALSSIAAPTTLYQLTVLSNNPIAYWRLNEGPDNGAGNDGTIAHDYAGGHNGAYTNTELGLQGFGSQDSTDTAALFGVFNLSPSNSYVGEINNSGNGVRPISFAEPLGSNGEFSVEAWVNSTNTQMLGAGIVAKGYGNGGEQFDLDVYNGFRFFVRDASGVVHGPGLSTVPTIGQWYHVVGVFDGANGVVRLYTNGVDAIDSSGIAAGVGVLTATTANTLQPQAAMVSIGARASSQSVTNYDFQFQGEIQDVALYNYALSAAQVSADYKASGLAVSPINLAPTNIVFSVASSQLQLSWPSDHTGWRLQAQTNSVTVGLSNNWVNVGGSTTTNRLVVPLNPANGTVFYRLVYP